MNWRENDLKVVELRERIIDLTEEFNQKKSKNIKNYHQKLNRFLNRRLRKMSDLIFAEHLLLSVTSLKTINRNI